MKHMLETAEGELREQTNVQLIKSEEAVEPGLHPADVAGDVDQSDVE